MRAVLLSSMKGMRDNMERMFREAAEQHGVELEYRKTGSFIMNPKDAFPDEDFPDFVIAYNTFTPFAHAIESMGIPVFNSPSAIDRCSSKMATTSALWGHGIAQPDTVFLPKWGKPWGEERIARHMPEIVERMGGYPFIIKGDLGSLGATVHLVRNEEELYACPGLAHEGRYMAQEFIEESNAEDLRFIIVDGKFVSCMKRVGASGDFRSNIALGGHREFYDPTDEERALAIGAANALGLTWAGVDIIQSQREPLVCEVNASPEFPDLDEPPGVHIPMFYFDAIMKEMERRHA